MPVNGVYYVVEAVPASKAKAMAVISAYISAENSNDSTLNQVLNLPGDPTGSLTPEANLELLGAVNRILPQAPRTVNTTGAYAEEIDFARRQEYSSIVKRLERLRVERRQTILGKRKDHQQSEA